MAKDSKLPRLGRPVPTYHDYLRFLDRTEASGLAQKFQFFAGQIVPANGSTPLPEWYVAYVLSPDFGTQPIHLNFDMPTQAHDIIASNLHGLLFHLALEKDVRVYSQGTYLRLGNSTHTPLPDLVLTSKSGEQRNKYHQLLNPVVVFEILSKSTRHLDQTTKLEAYQAIESVEEYLLIDQYKPYVTVHRRIGGQKWEQEFFSRPDQVVDIRFLGAGLRLAHLYEGVSFAQ